MLAQEEVVRSPEQGERGKVEFSSLCLSAALLGGLWKRCFCRSIRSRYMEIANFSFVQKFRAKQIDLRVPVAHSTKSI